MADSTPSLAAHRARSYPLLRLFATYRRAPGLLILAIILAIAANATVPLTQHLVGMAFGDLISGDAVTHGDDGALNRSGAWWWVMILLSAAVIRGLLAWLSTVSAFALAQQLLHHLRWRLLDQIQSLDLAWHRRHGAGEIIARTTRDGDKVRDAVIHGGRIVMETSLFLLGVLVFMTYYHWSLGLMSFVAITLATSLMWIQAPLLVRLDRHAGDRYDRLTQELSESVAGMRVIKAFRLEAYRATSFARLVSYFAGASEHAQRSAEWRLNIPQLVVAMNHAAAAFVGTYLVSQGILSVGHLTALLMMLLSVVFRVEGLARGFALFYEARASAARINDILDAQPAIYDGAQTLTVGALGIQYDGVGLAFHERPILADCSFRIEPGETIGLVGATGSGKSCLLSLPPRNQDAHAGTITLWSTDDPQPSPASDITLSSLRQAVHLVPQESFLFSASVRHNLTLVRPQASDTEIWEALRAAAAEDIIAGLPDGLDTLIGERGTTLSGGQKQRLCLARALIARPQLLLLDDATSALDSATEERVLAAISQLPMTVIMSASRLSTVNRVDRVLWLEGGRIRALAPHHELVARSADYGRLLGITAEDAA